MATIRDDHRAAWSAAGGVVMLAFLGLLTIAWQAGSGTTGSGHHKQVPEPAFGIFVVGAVIGFYFMLAPLLHWPPYRRAVTSGEDEPAGDVSLEVAREIETWDGKSPLRFQLPPAPAVSHVQTAKTLDLTISHLDESETAVVCTVHGPEGWTAFLHRPLQPPPVPQEGYNRSLRSVTLQFPQDFFHARRDDQAFASYDGRRFRLRPGHYRVRWIGTSTRWRASNLLGDEEVTVQ